jgi:hypothetical protein
MRLFPVKGWILRLTHISQKIQTRLLKFYSDGVLSGIGLGLLLLQLSELAASYQQYAHDAGSRDAMHLVIRARLNYVQIMEF